MDRIKVIAGVLIVIALTVLPAGVQAQGDDDGLVAEWHFDEGSGSVLADSSGNGNDGVIHGATWTDGNFGSALEFDGVDDYVVVPHSASISLSNAMTISAWVTADSFPDWSTVVMKSATSRWYDGYGMYYGSGDLRVFVTEYSSHKAHTPFSATSSFKHVVGTYDGNNIKIYIDGVEKSTTSTSAGISTNTASLTIGKGAGGVYQWDGKIDEIRIYNRALNAEEVKALYEGVQLSLTKSAAPHSIKQGHATTVTLTVKNTGTTEITDIEVSDTIPSDIVLVGGETSKTYLSLRPKDSREFQYALQLNEAGTFNLDPATVMYADEDGNYHTAKSKTAAIEVKPSLITTPTQTPTTTGSDAGSASVHLHGEKTDVDMGEDILLKLAAVNLITKPTMHVQVIITPPSGMSVTSSEFVQSGAGLYTTTYELKPGVGRDIEIRIRSNQVGDFDVNGRIVYYFGDDMEHAEDHTLTLPIKVRASLDLQQEETPIPTTTPKDKKGVPGFEAVLAVAGVLLVALFIKRRRVD